MMRDTRSWLLAVGCAQQHQHSVTGVANGDLLNICAQPEPRSTITGKLRYHAHGIIATGQQQRHGSFKTLLTGADYAARLEQCPVVESRI